MMISFLKKQEEFGNRFIDSIGFLCCFWVYASVCFFVLWCSLLVPVFALSGFPPSFLFFFSRPFFGPLKIQTLFFQQRLSNLSSSP